MDAERLFADRLNSCGLSGTAYYDVPPERPESFVVVQRTGGSRGEIVIDTPTLDLQCWAPTRRAAEVLADEVEAVARGMPAHVPNCFSVAVSSRYRDRDLETGTPRVHVVVQATLTD